MNLALQTLSKLSFVSKIEALNLFVPTIWKPLSATWKYANLESFFNTKLKNI
jgi:hypothetical protein